MTNSLPTATAPTIPPSQWSANSTPSTSSLDDRDFLNGLLFLKPEESIADALVTDQQVASESVRGKVVNLDSGSEHLPETIRYVQKPTLHELISGSQSTILPANALHLHLDGPSALLTTPHEPPYMASDVPYDCRPRARVRFRSRVRITSGFSRHRRAGDPEGISSTRSSSPSSSISAPLRSHADSRTTTWGTLGQRVGLLSLQKKVIGSPQLQQRQKKRIRSTNPNYNTDERTPLRGSSNLAAYGQGESMQTGDTSDEDEDDNRLSEEVDEIFGKFPSRLLNYHWWWWQIEPFICCHYAADWE